MPWIRLVPALAWAGVIFALSSISSPPGAPGTEWASLMAHATVFAILAVLLAWFVDSTAPARLLRSTLGLYAAVWLATVLYGISDEIHQAFVPGRSPAVVDVVADGVGAAVGLALWMLFRRKPWAPSPSKPGSASLKPTEEPLTGGRHRP